jgi:acetyl esterase/lipase
VKRCPTWSMVILVALLVACAAPRPTAAPAPTATLRPPTAAAPTALPTLRPTAAATDTAAPPISPRTALTVALPPTQALPTPEAIPTEGLASLQPPLPVTKTSDLAYTSGQLLDVYAPATPGNWPVVVVLPFGIGKGSMSGLASAIAGQGAVVFSVEWHSSEPRSVPEIAVGAEEVACAVRFARAFGAEYGAGDNRVVLVGHSAGGGIGALMMLAGDEFHGDCLTAQGSAVPDAFVGLDGTYDVISFIPEGVLRAAPAECARISPFTYVGQGPIRPGSRFVLFVSDNRLLLQQAQAFRDALRAAGHDVSLARIPRVDHLAIASGSVSETVGAIADLMRH